MNPMIPFHRGPSRFIGGLVWSRLVSSGLVSRRSSAQPSGNECRHRPHSTFIHFPLTASRPVSGGMVFRASVRPSAAPASSCWRFRFLMPVRYCTVRHYRYGTVLYCTCTVFAICTLDVLRTMYTSRPVNEALLQWLYPVFICSFRRQKAGSVLRRDKALDWTCVLYGWSGR